MIENFELIESLALNITMVLLFVMMGLAIHDVLQKNEVPLFGRIVAYGVLFLGAAGFIAKGIIQLFWTTNGI